MCQASCIGATAWLVVHACDKALYTAQAADEARVICEIVNADVSPSAPICGLLLAGTATTPWILR
jgi:hypothetical protein